MMSQIELQIGDVQELYVPWSCCRGEPMIYPNWTNPNPTNRSACQAEGAVEQYRPDYLYKTVRDARDQQRSYIEPCAVMCVE